MNLSQKGLLLLALPLVVQLSLIAALVFLQSQAEDEARKAQRAKDITESIDSICIHGYMTLKDGFERVGRNQDVPNDMEESITELEGKFVELRKLIKDDPKQLATVDDAATACSGLRDWMKEAQEASKRGELKDHSAAKSDLLKQLRAFGAKAASLMTMQRSSKKIMERSPKRQAIMRRQIKDVVIVCTGLNVVCLLGLGWFFSRYVVRGLAVIIDNSSRLVRKQPLNPRIEGADELARVDSAFHEMARALNEAEQLKKEVVQMVSHDLRSPLASISAFHEMLEHGVGGTLDANGKKMLKIALRNTGRMLDLVNDLLDIEKMESGKLQLQKEQVKLSDVFEQSIGSVMGPAGEAGVELEAVPTSIECIADQHRLVQVVTNLLSNAVKFSPPGSKVTIEAAQKEDKVEVRVTDQGRGIPEHMLKKIFGRFQQVELADSKDLGGTGLGLAICKALVELHDGDISVESEFGKGATFSFRIPLHLNKSDA